MLLLVFRKICLYLYQYVSDGPDLLQALLYNVEHILYTRTAFPNAPKREVYGILETFNITVFTMNYERIKCVPGLFWGFLRSRNSLVTTPKFSEAQKCEYPYVLLLNCYIILMIDPEVP